MRKLLRHGRSFTPLTINSAKSTGRQHRWTKLPIVHDCSSEMPSPVTTESLWHRPRGSQHRRQYAFGPSLDNYVGCATRAGGLFRVKIGEHDRKVLGVSQQSHDVDVGGAHEVEPSDRKAADSANSESGIVAQLARKWRSVPGIRSIARSDARALKNREPSSVAPSSTVPSAFNEVGLGQ